MDWIFFSIASFLVWSVSGIFSKFIRTKLLKRTPYYLVVFCFMGLFSLLFVPFTGLHVPGLGFLILAFLAGTVNTISLIPYIKALSIEEVSRVTPWWRFSSVFTLIIAFIFLNETLSSRSLIGFFLLVLGGFLIAVKDFKHIFDLRSGFYLMILACFFDAIHNVLLKYIYGSYAFFDVFIFSRIFTFLASLVFFMSKDVRNGFVVSIKSLNSKGTLVLFLQGILNLGGVLLFSYALKLGPASLVSALGGFQPLFIFIIALFVSIKMPNFIKEEINKKALITKSISILLIFAGLYFVYV